MHSKDFLAQELKNAGLEEMAKKAQDGYYHDYLSPLDLPEIQLDFDLLDAIIKGNKQATELRRRHRNGEFYATKEEGDAWMASPDGQAAIAELTKEKE